MTTDSAAKPEVKKVPRHRSPNYPSMNLERSLEKAALLAAKFKRHGVPTATALEAMEYKPDSSTGQQALASLSYFGLVEYEGSGNKRHVKVTDIAAKIIGDHSDRPRLLKEAALAPAIHREVWDKYHKGDDGLAPDATIKQYLQWDREGAKFNPEALDPFIEQFKQTIAFAGLDSSASISSDSAEKFDGAGADAMMEPTKVNTPTTRPPEPGTREFSFPLLDGVATLRVPHPMGQENYDLLTAVLAAMKSALVGQKKTENPS
ncbi:MAG: hypothetical protein U0638_15915 [Phycisphaerales bacterium]